MAVNCLTWKIFAGIFSLLIAGSVYAWDVRLECPEKWINGSTITLTAYVKKTSLATKCTVVPHSNNTLFRLDGADVCQVIPSAYTCDYTPPETVTTDKCDCADSSNQTFYKFVYQFVADKEKHNGTWDCQPSCPANAVVGGGYLLDNDNSPNCANVKVTDPDIPCPVPDCPDGERWLCPPWPIGPIIFGLFRLFAVLYFLLYVFYPAEYILWPFDGRLAWWEIFLMSVATVLFPECVVLDIIDAIRWRPCCCHSCNCSWRRILLLVLAILICLVSVIYMIIAAAVQLWPFPEITIDECERKDCECQCEGWQIFLFVVSCIGIALFICFLVAFLYKPPPDRGLLVKCGSCHKWRRFTVTLDDDTLQNIFILETLNEIFKKCANHDQAEFNIERIRQKIREILRKRGMADIRNVKLNQTVCLKDNESNKWYLQEPGRALPEAAMKGGWKWHAGNGTYVDRGEMVEILQIRLYLLSEDGHEGAVEMGRVNNVSRAQ